MIRHGGVRLPPASTYTEELGERICEAFESSPLSLRQTFEARDDLPTLTTVYRWEQQIPAFGERLARARRIRAHVLAESVLEIADHTERDTLVKTDRNGDEYEVANHEWINRSRLRVESRRWFAQKLNPSTYGERIEQGGSVEVVHRIHVGPKPE